jgi:hypothetical protein
MDKNIIFTANLYKFTEKLFTEKRIYLLRKIIKIYCDLITCLLFSLINTLLIFFIKYFIKQYFNSLRSFENTNFEAKLTIWKYFET